MILVSLRFYLFRFSQPWTSRISEEAFENPNDNWEHNNLEVGTEKRCHGFFCYSSFTTDSGSFCFLSLYEFQLEFSLIPSLIYVHLPPSLSITYLVGGRGIGYGGSSLQMTLKSKHEKIRMYFLLFETEMESRKRKGPPISIPTQEFLFWGRETCVLEAANFP